jgi:hypothetical protein
LFEIIVSLIEEHNSSGLWCISNISLATGITVAAYQKKNKTNGQNNFFKIKREHNKS